MASAVPISIVVKLKLNNGVGPSGAVKTIGVPLGGTTQKINVPEYNSDLASNREQVLNISDALEPCLDKVVYTIDEIVTSALSN